MNTSLVITLLGRDRPGLVSALAASISACGANWLESNMAQLAGQFAGIVRLQIAEADVGKLKAALQKLEADGLHLTIEEAVAAEAIEAPKVSWLDLIGQDRPGIVREISTVLARHGVSIDRLNTTSESAGFSGECLFRAEIALHIPSSTDVAAMQTELEALANELMVDITLGDEAKN